MREKTSRREQAAILALAARAPQWHWHLVARLVGEAGQASDIAAGRLTGFETPELLAEVDPSKLPVDDAELDRNEALIAKAEERGDRIITVLDDDYPQNLRLVYDRPPFLFVRGRLEPGDARAIAVVGTRQASDAGLEQADRLARGLAQRDVTVVSGLARGIDGAAHRGALAAGGRTIAVMGTGIRLVYPREHASLASEIVESGGALVSQFWLEDPPTRYRFPLRNRTMSGLALGTVVVEASRTSGARMQARAALEHTKRVFLVRDLVTREQWTYRYRDHPGVTEVSDVGDILEVLDRLAEPASQLTLA